MFNYTDSNRSNGDGMMSPSVAELAQALSKAQEQIKHAKKDSKNPFYKTNYADLASIQDVSRGPLSANQLSVSQLVIDAGTKIYLVCFLMHSSGQWLRSVIPIRTAKEDMQSLGSSITYARRYSLAAIVGVATEDDDAEGAVPKINIHQKKLILLLMKNLNLNPNDENVQKRFRDLTGKREMGYWTEEDADKAIESLYKKLETEEAKQEKEKSHHEVQQGPSHKGSEAKTDSRVAHDANQKGDAKQEPSST